MRVCSNCGSDKTYLAKGKYPQWYIGGTICHNCHALLWNKNNPDKVKMNSLRRINPRGKRHLSIKENPRIGICFLCFKIGGKTDIHHYDKYYENPLKNTIELCAGCHGIITRLETPPVPRDSKTGRFISNTSTSAHKRIVQPT